MKPELKQSLDIYEKLLLLWQGKLNLVAESTLSNLWDRHFRDSLQLLPQVELIKNVKLLHVKQFDIISEQNASRETFCITDVGSGAGFPGLVLACAGHPVHLVESDQRKAAFLREVALKTGAPATIHCKRVEDMEHKADLVTARAFAPLEKILSQTEKMRDGQTVYLLLKSQDMDEELTKATKSWYFSYDMQPSETDPRGCILRLWNVVRR